MGRPVHLGDEVEALEQRDDLGDDRLARAGAAQRIGAEPLALGDRRRQRFGRAEFGKELVDLEGARQAAARPRVRRAGR